MPANVAGRGNRPDYERVRREPTLFFVRSGHEQPQVEDAVEHAENYAVVRKAGEAAEMSRRLDPPDP